MPDEVFIITQLKEVHVGVPERFIGGRILVMSDLIKDARVCNDILWVELVADFLE